MLTWNVQIAQCCYIFSRMTKRPLKLTMRPRDRRLLKLKHLFGRDDAYEFYWTYDVVRRAIWMANTDKTISNDRIVRELRVLPPRTPYYIDPHGGYLGAPKAIATHELDEHPRLVEKARRYLIAEIDRTIAGKEPKKSRMVTVDEILSGARIVELVDTPPSSEWWGKMSIHERQIHDPRVCTPTIEDFVTYATTVMRQKPWCRMLRRCASPDCRKFFLTPKKIQRPSKTCLESEQCRLDWINYRQLQKP